MAIPHHIPVSSINLISQSVKSDQQTFRWFAFLISQPKFIEHLKTIPETTPTLQSYQTKSLLSLFLAISSFIAIMLTAIQFKLSTLLLALAIFLGFKLVQNEQKNSLSQLIRAVLIKDIGEEDIKFKTLYQVSEFYSKKYNIPSLIDTIYHLDNFARKIVIVITFVFFIVYSFVFQFSLLLGVAYASIAYFSLLYLLQTTFAYRILK